MLSLLSIALLAAPDVYFVSVDTLRADHLGCYGHTAPTSPNIDSLAAHALVFDDCVAEVPLTAPSFGAMLTSRFPRETGTVRNGIAMPEDVPTVAEIFRDAGYQTVCIQSNWTLKADLFHIDRGFEKYDDDFHRKRWGVIKPERYADEVTGRALEALANRDPARPLFLWVHYSDPHAPYRFHNDHAPSGRPRPAAAPQQRAMAKYDSEVAYADHHLGLLLNAIGDGARVLFTADHGESLYEHDYLGHGRNIHQPGVRIPLIVRVPGLGPGRTQAPARGVDIGPTLLAMAGLAPAPGARGVSLLAGRDRPRRPRVIETYGGAVPRMPVLDGFMAGRPPMQQGAIDAGWKLVRTGDKTELFDLARDPGEEVDVAADHPERVRHLNAQIEAWNAACVPGAAEASPLTDEDIRALESLGYVE